MLTTKTKPVEQVVTWETIKANPCVNSFRYKYLKRLFDIVVTSVGLIILTPFLVIIALLVKLTSPGPILYWYPVVGLEGRVFKSCKFRSMVNNADQLKKQLLAYNEMTGPVFKIKKDPRITNVGRFLRKFSLDEFPQLFLVLKGDLSLVGPRPPSYHEFLEFEDWHKGKLSIKPGVTCLWQVQGRNKISQYEDWIQLDLDYINGWSLWKDLVILLKTIPAVVGGSGY